MHTETPSEEETSQPGVSDTGICTGVTGPTVENVGTLDLRTTRPEDIATLRRVRNTGLVLVAPGSRGALSGVAMENVGSVVEAGPDERLIVGPSIEFDGETLEAMDDGQSLIVVGIVHFGADATPALVSQKFTRLRLTGILFAPKAVQGALVGRMEHSGITITLPKTSGAIVRQMGEKTVTAGYLGFLKDASTFVNVGQTIFGDDVPLDLLQTKIAAYVNVGCTIARRELLDYLEAVGEGSPGAFETPEPDAG